MGLEEFLQRFKLTRLSDTVSFVFDFQNLLQMIEDKIYNGSSITVVILSQ